MYRYYPVLRPGLSFSKFIVHFFNSPSILYSILKNGRRSSGLFRPKTQDIRLKTHSTMLPSTTLGTGRGRLKTGEDYGSRNLTCLTEFSFFAAVLEGVIDNGAGQNNGAEDGEVQRARYS